MFTSKTTAPPTVEERLAGAAATRAAALSVLERAADDLAAAETEARDVAYVLAAEIDRLAVLRLDAIDEATHAAVKAEKIRALVG